VVRKGVKIEEPAGKLGVLIPGLGAVSTTFIAGIEAVKKNIAKPIGSLTQMGTIRLGKRTDKRVPAIKDFVPLANIQDLVFGGWDIYNDNCFQSASNAGVLEKSLLESVRPEIEKIVPWKAVFSQDYVKRLNGPNVKTGKNKMELAEQVMDDIEKFRAKNNLSRMVMVWCGSTEVFLKPEAAHANLEAFEKAMRENDPAIAPSMVYAYAAISKGIPFANGAPNLTVDIPALTQFAQEKGVPICGKDFKTGQTLMKTILAPGLKSRMLGLSGWFSTNILGNRDGEVLDDPDSFKTKEESKLSVLDQILQPELYPDLYKTLRTRCGSTTTRPAATTRKGGTTSISTVGSATPCRLKSTSFVETASSPLPSSSISSCSSILPNAAGCAEFRNG
jgi:myo-inositol-1-phosphate synthase